MDDQSEATPSHDLVVPAQDRLTELAYEITSLKTKFQKVASVVLLAIGRHLHEARSLLPSDPAFGQWRKANTTLSSKAAYRAMEWARMVDETTTPLGESYSDTVSDKNPPGEIDHDALNFLVRDGTKDNRDAAIEAAKSGVVVTLNNAKQLVQQHEAPEAGSQTYETVQPTVKWVKIPAEVQPSPPIKKFVLVPTQQEVYKTEWIPAGPEILGGIVDAIKGPLQTQLMINETTFKRYLNLAAFYEAAWALVNMKLDFEHIQTAEAAPTQAAPEPAASAKAAPKAAKPNATAKAKTAAKKKPGSSPQPNKNAALKAEIVEHVLAYPSESEVKIAAKFDCNRYLVRAAKKQIAAQASAQ